MGVFSPPFSFFLFFFLALAFAVSKKDRYMDISTTNSTPVWAKHCPKFDTLGIIMDITNIFCPERS